MNIIYNIYCDESCHLPNDHQQAMVLGALCCPLEKTREIAVRLREIKIRHKLSPKFEVKWSKVSPAKFSFYKDLIDYFFDDDDLHFRALIIPDKLKLHHQHFSQDYNTFYYNLYYNLLKTFISSNKELRIYISIDNTNNTTKINRLYDFFSNKLHQSEYKMIKRIQTIHSNEVEHLQLADLLIGALSYANRDLSTSSAKLDLIERIKARSHYDLMKTTVLQEEKINLFRWEAS
jgi:hypothetical protein